MKQFMDAQSFKEIKSLRNYTEYLSLIIIHHLFFCTTLPINERTIDKDMKTKFLKIVISTAVIFPAAQTAVLANSYTTKGFAETSDNFGDGWSLDEGVLTLEAGRIQENNQWRFLGSRVREIRIQPNGSDEKLILPENSSCMFWGFSNLTNIDASSFDTSHVQDMDSMFYNCSSLRNLDLSGFDTGNVTNMNCLFGNCSSLESLDLSAFDTGKVQEMHHLFFGCSSLKSVNLSSFDTSSVSSFDYMFANCQSLESLDLSSFKAPKLESCSFMFYRCSSLKSLDLSNFDFSKTEDGQDADMFYGCSSLQGVNS
ncbi:MAG: BspA family leucine-rich repeat surface protein [Erysipelotrichaceae bacterium]|nr:BspA family leucine-rich repeat surface protein [Erysipelotrichaceae bacterium]